MTIDTNPLVNDYLNLLFTHGFLQVITKPTRCTSTTATLIDHCITNSDQKDHFSRIITNRISDHFPILFRINKNERIKDPKMVQFRDFSSTNINNFKQYLGAFDWNIVYNIDDTQNACNKFFEQINNAVELFFPLKTQRFNKNIHRRDPWFTKGLLVSRKNKNQLKMNFIECPTDANNSAYKKYLTIYNKVVREAKKMFYRTQLQKNQSNLKKTWALIRDATNLKPSKNKNNIVTINLGQTTSSDPEEIANYFNNYFATAPGIITETIPPPLIEEEENDPVINENIPLFKLSDQPVCVDEILGAVKLLEPKTSQDRDSISMFLIKNTIDTIVEPLRYIFNLSFNNGHFPENFKISKVIPIYKTGDQMLVDNYRPIALLSNFAKILEKVMYNRLITFLEANEIISGSQFGFRAGHSTIHPLMHFQNYISEALNKKEHVIAVFCDLRKAFDTVNHKILLEKLKKIGIRDTELEWFRSYLSDRKQFVCIKGNNSNNVTMKIGVPQGSVLGPILFLIYINDLPLCNKLKNLLFADDTTLLASGKNINALFALVNAEFYNVVTYFRKNGLAIHPNKTKYIIFTNNNEARSTENQIYVNFNNKDENDPLLITPISRVSGQGEDSAIKFLGIYIDPKLNFKFHTNKILKKISSALYFMRKARHLLDEKSLTAIYYSLIHCHLIYGIQIWSTCNLGIINNLFKIQKKAIRLIHGAPYNSHTESLFKKSRILPLPKLIEYFNIQFMQKFVHGLLPNSFVNTWTSNVERHALRGFGGTGSYILRNSEDLYIPRSQISSLDRHPYFLLPRLWTNFTEHSIKHIRDKTEFNFKLKEYLLNQLNSNYVCTRLFCPHCSTIVSNNETDS